MADSKNVTRIKATDATDTSPKKSGTSKAVKPIKVSKKKTKKLKVPKEPKNWFIKMLVGIGRYFKGAWYELMQVRWPSRKATWGLTLAVLIFSAFFVILIILLDVFFKFIFELIIV